MQKIKSNLFKIISNIIQITLLIVFTKSHVFGANESFEVIENQVNIKEALPVWIMPPFLLCKDNTFLGEMQIPFFRADKERGTTEAKNCNKTKDANKIKRTVGSALRELITSIYSYIDSICLFLEEWGCNFALVKRGKGKGER